MSGYGDLAPGFRKRRFTSDDARAVRENVAGGDPPAPGELTVAREALRAELGREPTRGEVIERVQRDT